MVLVSEIRAKLRNLLITVEQEINENFSSPNYNDLITLRAELLKDILSLQLEDFDRG